MQSIPTLKNVSVVVIEWVVADEEAVLILVNYQVVSTKILELLILTPDKYTGCPYMNYYSFLSFKKLSFLLGESTNANIISTLLSLAMIIRYLYFYQLVTVEALAINKINNIFYLLSFYTL